MLRVVIADDHQLVRSGVKRVVEARGIAVIGEASTADEAIGRVSELLPDVLLLDLNMPGGGGIEVLRRVRLLSPETRSLVVTAHLSADYMHFSMRAGAHGFIGKDAPVPRLIEAIDTIARGGTYFPVETDDGIARALTEREFQILPLLARGLNHHAIAAELGVRVKTVDTHRYKILRKLGLSTNGELTLLAIRRGWIDP